MRKMITVLLALALMTALAVPGLATEVTQPTADAQALPATNPNGSHIMAVICLVLLVLGGIYLIFGLKKSKEV